MLSLVLCDNLEGWNGVGGGREVQEGEDMCILWLIYVDVWQKPTQHCKTIILELKINLKKRVLRIPRWCSGKESTCQCRKQNRHGFDPWIEEIPRVGNGNPLQYSCLENYMDRGVWWTTQFVGSKESDMPKHTYTHTCTWIHVYVWLNPFTVHLKLSQHCLLIGYTPIQNRKLQKLNMFFPLKRCYLLYNERLYLPP